MPTPRPWNLLAWLWLLVIFLRELALSAWAVIKVTLAREVRVSPASSPCRCGCARPPASRCWPTWSR